MDQEQFMKRLNVFNVDLPPEIKSGLMNGYKPTMKQGHMVVNAWANCCGARYISGFSGYSGGIKDDKGKITVSAVDWATNDIIRLVHHSSSKKGITCAIVNHNQRRYMKPALEACGFLEAIGNPNPSHGNRSTVYLFVYCPNPVDTKTTHPHKENSKT